MSQKTQDELSRESTPFIYRSSGKRSRQPTPFVDRSSRDQSRQPTPFIYRYPQSSVIPGLLPAPDPPEVQDILYPNHDAPEASVGPDDIFDADVADMHKLEPQTSDWDPPDYWDLPDQQPVQKSVTKLFRKRKQTTRIGRSMYHAIDKRKRFGLIDTGYTDPQGYQVLILHTPKSSPGMPDIYEGQTYQVESCLVSDTQGTIRIGYVTPHKYFRPGVKVTSCVVGVSKREWDSFVDLSK
jgi:hypothetical protein